MLLEVTPSARDHLVRTRSNSRFDEHARARFTTTNGKVGLTFALTPASSDVVVNANGMEIYVAAEVVDKLSGGIIDTRGVPDGEALVFISKDRASQS